jgi:hypothetical protein
MDTENTVEDREYKYTEKYLELVNAGEFEEVKYSYNKNGVYIVRGFALTPKALSILCGEYPDIVARCI